MGKRVSMALPNEHADPTVFFHGLAMARVLGCVGCNWQVIGFVSLGLKSRFVVFFITV